MNLQKLQRFVKIEHERRELEGKLAVLKQEKDLLETELLEIFEGSGVQSTKVDGLTVYIHRQLWALAKDGEKGKVCDALEGAGLQDFIQRTYNTQTLSAYVRELQRNGETLPPDVAGTLNIEEKYSLRTRRS